MRRDGEEGFIPCHLRHPTFPMIFFFVSGLWRCFYLSLCCGPLFSTLWPRVRESGLCEGERGCWVFGWGCQVLAEKARFGGLCGMNWVVD